MAIATKLQMTNELVETVSKPEFMNFIQEIEDQPSNTRLEYAKSITNADELKSRGIVLPESVKISIRLFEGESTSETFTEDKKAQLLLNGGWSICVGGILTIGYQFEK